TVQEGMVRLLT
nr:immunoglobulin heavy chain junction region [Mus musculus]